MGEAPVGIAERHGDRDGLVRRRAVDAAVRVDEGVIELRRLAAGDAVMAQVEAVVLEVHVGEVVGVVGIGEDGDQPVAAAAFREPAFELGDTVLMRHALVEHAVVGGDELHPHPFERRPRL